ncbi:MAG: DUF2493 domain-containing protein [Chloroflexia bacterium]|nr:DUF2493 domain-containing protein [Chloroflexia bacterium]
MTLGVIGSRKFTDEALLRHHLDMLQQDISAIVNRGAKGADQMAEAWAKDKGIPTIIFLHEYDKYGRGAPLKRNHLIIAESDHILAIIAGESRGTHYTIRAAEKTGKEVEIATWGLNI